MLRERSAPSPVGRHRSVFNEDIHLHRLSVPFRCALFVTIARRTENGAGKVWVREKKPVGFIHTYEMAHLDLW